MAQRLGLRAANDESFACITVDGDTSTSDTLLAFATGASFAGAMGVIFAAKQAFIDPKSFDYFQSIGVLSMVILGGMGNIAGVMVGAVVVTLLNLMVLPTISEVMQAQFPNINQNLDPSKYQRLIFGLVLVFMMLGDVLRDALDPKARTR